MFSANLIYWNSFYRNILNMPFRLQHRNVLLIYLDTNSYTSNQMTVLLQIQINVIFKQNLREMLQYSLISQQLYIGILFCGASIIIIKDLRQRSSKCVLCVQLNYYNDNTHSVQASDDENLNDCTTYLGYKLGRLMLLFCYQLT